VTVLAIGFGSSESVERLGDWQDQNEMLFIFAEGPADMVRTFNVTSQSTKFGISRDGVIQFRHGYGASSSGTWAERLSDLAADS
jgi:hypothetical protein